MLKQPGSSSHFTCNDETVNKLFIARSAIGSAERSFLPWDLVLGDKLPAEQCDVTTISAITNRVPALTSDANSMKRHKYVQDTKKVCRVQSFRSYMYV